MSPKCPSTKSVITSKCLTTGNGAIPVAVVSLPSRFCMKFARRPVSFRSTGGIYTMTKSGVLSMGVLSIPLDRGIASIAPTSRHDFPLCVAARSSSALRSSAAAQLSTHRRSISLTAPAAQACTSSAAPSCSSACLGFGLRFSPSCFSMHALSATARADAKQENRISA